MLCKKVAQFLSGINEGRGAEKLGVGMGCGGKFKVLRISPFVPPYISLLFADVPIIEMMC